MYVVRDPTGAEVSMAAKSGNAIDEAVRKLHPGASFWKRDRQRLAWLDMKELGYGIAPYPDPPPEPVGAESKTGDAK